MNFFRHLRSLVLIAGLLLAACGGTPAAEAPTAVPAPPPTAAAAPPPTTAPPPTSAPAAPPTPTFERVSDTEPTVGAVQVTGALAWRDQVLRNDSAIVSVSGLPALESDQTYAAWLSGKDRSLALGTLGTNGGTLTLTYVSPTNDNLLGAFERVYITRGPDAEATTEIKNVVMTGTLPPQALVHIRHVLFSIGNTPGQIGFALGLRQETDELLRHAQFLKDALDAGDFRLVKVHAEHLANIIEGSEAHDVNGDGKIQNPGDGFGLLPNGQQDGYIKGMIDHARLAAEASDATEAIKLHAGHVQVAGENTRLRIQDIHDRADKIAAAGGISETQQDVLTILALAQQTIQGADTNLDEQVGPIPGEGGVLTAYQHAQLMAGVPLAPAAGVEEQAPPPAPAPAPAEVEAFAIEIGDNSYTPNKLTIPVGATVVWTSKGQRPHTVTADDGSFDSGSLDAGGTFKHTFEQVGTFGFFCQFHGGPGGQSMAGQIIVADQSAAAALPAAPAGQAPAPTAAAGPTQAADQNHAAGDKITVAIGDNSYTPKEISVPVGATVVWSHGGQRPHTVTADDSSFNSDTLNNGASFEQQFTTPGAFAYYCEFHGGPGGQAMSGVIKVGDGGGSAPAQQAQAPEPTAAPAAPTAAPPPAAAPAAVEVSMKDFEFGPKQITVKVGTTITWTNDGAKPHSATAADKSFDTTIFQPGESKSAIFTTPGTFAYYCQLHGTPDGNGMVGTVVVET